MATSGIQVKGLRETVRTLEKFGAAAADLKAAFTRIGNLVANEAKVLAPRKSGKLAGTIKASNTKNKSIVRAGSGIAYAGVQNYGWPRHNIEGKHFMETALQTKQDEAFTALNDELHGLIRNLGLNT